MDGLFWALLGLGLLLAELFLPGLVVVFFGLGALVTAALTPFLPGPVLQIATWLLLSGASLFGLRRYAQRWFRGRDLLKDQNASEAGGLEAEVTEAITPNLAGRISFQGTTWEARSFDETFAVGDKVQILRQDGLVYYVTRSLIEDKSKAFAELSRPTQGGPHAR